jgi:hypothetical protein
MKLVIFLLIFCSLSLAYVVDNSSIIVGISVPNNYDGSTMAMNALKSTLTSLGFNYYQSPTGNGSDYEAHGCQVVYNGRFSYPVTGWDWRMSLDGRGYIQQACYGEPVWPYFGGGYQFYCGYPAVTLHVYREGNCELLNFPNLMPPSWLAHANNYSYDPVSHVLFLSGVTSYCPSFENNAAVEDVTNPGSTRKLNLTSHQMGKGRGVLCGWQIYGPEASNYDKNLFENLIIYAAQPPKAEAGGPYCAPVGVPVTLNASGSTDDQQIVLYQWDINNDGEYEISTPNPTAQWTWNQPYNDSIELRVKDNLNCRSYDWAYGQIGFVDVNPDTLGTIKSLYH